MRHIIKGLDVFLDFDSVHKRFDSIFVLVHRREQAIWNHNGWSVLRVYHRRMSGHGSNERRADRRGQGCNLDEKPKRKALKHVE